MTKKRSIENFSLKINEIFQKLAWKNLNVFDPDSRLPHVISDQIDAAVVTILIIIHMTVNMSFLIIITNTQKQ